MSENEEQVPLTRRERRLREQGETGALDLSEVSAATAESATTDTGTEANSLDDEIEISPLNADGTPRSRREIRMLREQALADRAAEQEAEATAQPHDNVAHEVDAEQSDADAGLSHVEQLEPETPAEQETPESEPVVEAESEQSVTAEEAAETEVADVAAPAIDEPAEDFDSLISPPTEPFTVEELRAAEASPEIQEPQAEDLSAEVETSSSTAEIDAPAPVTKPRRKFWKRDKTANTAETEPTPAPEEAAPEAVEAEIIEAQPADLDDDVEISKAEVEVESTDVENSDAKNTDVENSDVDVAEVDTTDDTAAEVVETIAQTVDVTETEAPEAESLEEAEFPATEALITIEAEEVELEVAAADTVGAPEADAAAETPTKDTYSFPDIAPPEEWRSVFDDPATRNVPAPIEEPQGDFDDLISRAVAQEGSTNGSSALILPSMPEDTGGLTGPLGATGELYVTGSMRLPKSLGETGGHVSLHDSAEIDPITGAEAESEHGSMAGPAPVSARHAVSARVVSGVPAVAKPTKERTKLPLVLGLTGGGLLVVVVGLGVWGASNGMFG